MNSLVSNQTHNLIGKVMIWRKIVAFLLGFEGRKGIRKCFWVWRTKVRQEKEVGAFRWALDDSFFINSETVMWHLRNHRQSRASCIAAEL